MSTNSCDKQKVLDLIREPWSSYAEAKRRSEEIDQIIGYDIRTCEQEIQGLQSGKKDWSELSPQIFQTPYPELAEIVQMFTTNHSLRWVDFGAGYGRLGLVLGLLRPQDSFCGFEFVEQRVRLGALILDKWANQQTRLFFADLNSQDFMPPEADLFFVFDFGTPQDIHSLLVRLRQRAPRQPMTVIGRGRATRHLIATEHPWLSQVEEPLHTPHWSLYRSSPLSHAPCQSSKKIGLSVHGKI